MVSLKKILSLLMATALMFAVSFSFAKVNAEEPAFQEDLDEYGCYFSLSYSYDVNSKNEISNANFKLACAIDNGLGSIVSKLPEGASFGVQVNDGKDVQNFNLSELSALAVVDYTEYDGKCAFETEEADKRYTFIELGDVFANPDRFSKEFTICAYIYDGSDYYLSKIQKTYSVASLIEAYHAKGVQAVESCYNRCVGLNLIQLDK